MNSVLSVYSLELTTTAFGLLLANTLQVLPSAAQQGANPWTPERTRAVVRIEVPNTAGPNPVVGTGFIVQGIGDRYFVLTSTHVVLPNYDPAQQPSSDCLPLLPGTRLVQGNSGGPTLTPRCAYHLGSDTSLVELEPRDDRYPVLVLSSRPLVENDRVSLAGFPLSYSRVIRSGTVSLTTGPDQTIVTDITTAPGMSGGPYLLSPGGVVIGVHRGGAKYTAGFAHMTPISFVRTKLEVYVRPISNLVEATTGEGNVAKCRREKEEQLRAELQPFTRRLEVHCGPGSSSSKVQEEFVYDVTKEKPGYALAGFVSHTDNVQFGRVGMLRYETNNAEYITGVRITLRCDVSMAGAPKEGWAESTLSGYLKKAIDKKAIEKSCEAMN